MSFIKVIQRVINIIMSNTFSYSHNNSGTIFKVYIYIYIYIKHHNFVDKVYI